MTTNIESALADMLEGLSVSDGYYTLSIGRVGAVKMAERIVRNEPDLLDALGAVSTADMAREIGEEVARRKAAEAERDEYRMAAEAEAEGLNEWQARAKKAEATIARVRELAEKWRYKGEFGWGPWQEGEGPDPEGHILDCASSDLRDALDPKPAVKQIILTADMPGIQINGYDFIEGVLTKLPAADADRLISAGLAKAADK